MIFIGKVTAVNRDGANTNTPSSADDSSLISAARNGDLNFKALTFE